MLLATIMKPSLEVQKRERTSLSRLYRIELRGMKVASWNAGAHVRCRGIRDGEATGTPCSVYGTRTHEH